MLTEASCHRGATCSIFVHISRQVIFACDLHFVGLNGKVCSKDSSGHLSTVLTVADVASSTAGKEFRVVYLDRNRTTQTVSLHVMY
jgi:hypothetical protein